MSAVMEMSSPVATGIEVSEASFIAFCKAAFDQAVDAIRGHDRWVPLQQTKDADLFGFEAIDGKLIVELAWIFGAEGQVLIPFETACEEIGLDPHRFRRICRRNYPRECAWLEANVGILRD